VAGAGGATVECRSGVCVQTACDAGLTNCAGGLECTDLATDPNNCGTCGTVCESGVCTSGVCSEPTTTPATPAAPSPTTTPPTDEAANEQQAASTGSGGPSDQPRRDRSSRTRAAGSESSSADTAPPSAKQAKVKPAKVKPATEAPESVLAWPFDPEAGQWTIVNGYRGEEEHAPPTGSRRNASLFALDFAVCRPEDVDAENGTCDLGPSSGSGGADGADHDWDTEATQGATVLAPVDGTVAWTEEANATCRSVGLDIKGHPGYRLTLFNVEELPDQGQPVKRGKRIGKVAKGGCEGGDHLHMALYKPQAGADDDPVAGREGVPFSGDWVIDGCDYPDDKKTANQYRGVLVPCSPEDDA
jgi:murein DD-endopeptidase MepM/ murein hydrolase activator NlpD